MNLNMDIAMPKLHNYFTVKVLDSKTREVIQEARAENVVLDTFYHFLAGRNTFSRIHQSKIYFGDGTGVPAATDTGLFHATTSKDIGNPSPEILSDDLAIIKKHVVFQDTEYIGGVITELGIYLCRALNVYLPLNHAMLQDVNGNAISIGPKTNTQIIEVDVSVYIERTDGMLPFPNALTDIFENTFSVVPNAVTLQPTAVSIGSGGTYDSSNKTYTSGVTRIAAGTGNGRGTQDIRYIERNPLEPILFPNADIFPTFHFSSRTIAVGDGEKLGFNLQSQFFKPGTVVVKVNDVLQVNGIDYELFQGSGCALHDGTPYPYNTEMSADLYNSLESDTPVKENYKGNFALNLQYLLVDFKAIIPVTQLLYTVESNNTHSITWSTDRVNWNTYSGTSGVIVPMIYARYIYIESTSSRRPVTSFYVLGNPNIYFEVPPEEGAVITAEWDTDIPPKNANLAYDTQWSMTSSW